MTKNTVRHRHFVAFPAFLVLLGLSFAQTFVDIPDLFLSMHSSASVTGVEEAFIFDSGIYGTLYSGVLRQEGAAIVMDNAAAVLATDSVLRIQIGDARITGVNGSLYVLADNDGVTIAALTTPAFIVYRDQRMVVPAGMQWQLSYTDGIAPLTDGFALWMESRTPSMLPNSFIQRKMQDLSSVSKPTVSLPKMYENVHSDGKTLFNLLLPVSADKVLAAKHQKALGALRFAVDQGNAVALEEVLAQDIVAESIQTPYGEDTIVRLLSGQDTAVQMLLLQQLARQESFWSVASMHPLYSGITWSLFEPETSVESQLTRVFMLPYAAQTAPEFPVFVFDRHLATIEGILDKVGDSVAFTENFLTAHVPTVFALETLEFPRRARSLRSTLSELMGKSLEKTSRMQEAHKILLTLDRINTTPLQPKQEEAPGPEEVVEAEPEVLLTAEQVEAKAYDMLTDAGALFSVQSAVAAFAPNQARVSNIVFSTPKEDRTVSFTIDVVLSTVTDIEVNGNGDFPYSPTFEGFVTWIAK